MLTRPSLGSLLISLSFLVVAPCYAVSTVPTGGLGVFWTATQPSTLIKVFGPDELKKLKHAGSTEVDPATGKKSRFEGILLADVIDHALNGATNDRKALIDLVILKGAHGAEALIPRSFVVKYPVILATSENRKSLPALRSIVPWTSRSRTRTEGLPLETYFVSDLVEVELGNYQQRYGSVFLKRRTDPLAMRGEKIFVQDCMSCHDSSDGAAKARNWVGKHPSLQSAPRLDDREQRALRSYLDQFKSENSVPGSKPNS